MKQNKQIQPSTQPQQSELIGGLRNAIDRKESIQKAAQSFLNAGYKKQQIDQAIRELRSSPKPAQTQQPQKQKLQDIVNKKAPRWLPISIIIVLILIIAGAVTIFWPQIISWFS